MARTLYTLQVFLLNAPVGEESAETNPSVMRTIEIHGDQTLGRLHVAILNAFATGEQQVCDFQFGDAPHDRSGRRYRPPSPVGVGAPLDASRRASDAAEMTIDSLGLEVGHSYRYWFDLGGDWYHQIDVLAIGEPTAETWYPRVTARVGESPPQYMDWDAEEREDGEE